jgi:hypothetical protein
MIKKNKFEPAWWLTPTYLPGRQIRRIMVQGKVSPGDPFLTSKKKCWAWWTVPVIPVK